MCNHPTLRRRGGKHTSSVVSLDSFPLDLDDFPWDCPLAAAVAVAAPGRAAAGPLSWVTGTITVRGHSKVSPWCGGEHFISELQS